MRAEMLSGRLLDAERQRNDVMQRLDSYKRAAARAEKDWELERNNLHVGVMALLVWFCVVLSVSLLSVHTVTKRHAKHGRACCNLQLLSLHAEQAQCNCSGTCLPVLWRATLQFAA